MDALGDRLDILSLDDQSMSERTEQPVLKKRNNKKHGECWVTAGAGLEEKGEAKSY